MTNTMTKDALILLWCIVLALLAGITATILQPTVLSKPTLVQSSPGKLQPVAVQFEDIEAKSAILFDAKTGEILFEKNAQVQLPLASLAKLATALAVLSSGEDRFVTIREEDLLQEGDSGLKVGDVWRLRDLVAFSLTTSSNDGMSAATQVLTLDETVSKMNSAAAIEGLEQSYFLNTTGLDVSSSTAGAYGSALDVAHLVERLLKEHGSVFEATVNNPIPNGESGKGAVSTLQPIWNMPGLIAAKTGYTDLAGGNLAIAVDMGIGQPVIAVVLGSTKTGRFEDVQLLIDSLRKAQTNESL